MDGQPVWSRDGKTFYDWNGGRGTGEEVPFGLVVKQAAARMAGASSIQELLTRPQINLLWAPQSVGVSAQADFRVQASGSPPPSYRWQFNGQDLEESDRIQGVASATLTIRAADAGTYTVTVANRVGQVTSKAAKLALGLPATIKTQPQSIGVLVGKTVSFRVSAAGTTPLSYQWQFNGIDLVNSKVVTGATTASMTLKGVTEASKGRYTVRISNPLGQVMSSPAFLVVRLPPVTTGQPQNQNVVMGQGVRFEVSAQGDPAPGYQWLKDGKPLTDGGRISGTGTAVLLIAGAQSADAGVYTVEVRNLVGMQKSKPAQLKVAMLPMLAQQATNQYVVAGKKAGFSVKAVGTSPLTYQWFFNRQSLANGNGISGATTAQLSISSAKAHMRANTRWWFATRWVKFSAYLPSCPSDTRR